MLFQILLSSFLLLLWVPGPAVAVSAPSFSRISSNSTRLTSYNKSAIDFPIPRRDSLRPLVLFAYSESDYARENLEFIVEKALNAAADFIFIFNGPTDASKMVPTYYPNVRVIERDNTCFDLGSYGVVLRNEGLIDRYKRFIMMNASVRGPFLPQYAQDKCWMDIFLDRITDKVKLVGHAAWCHDRAIEGQLWATDDVGIHILNNDTLVPDWNNYLGNYKGPVRDYHGPVGISACFEDKGTVMNAEFGASLVMRQQGYEIDALMASMSPYKSIDEYCEKEAEAMSEAGSNEWASWWPNNYFGSKPHMYEMVFYKTNRDTDPPLVKAMTRWHMAQNYTSWDSCKAK